MFRKSSMRYVIAFLILATATEALACSCMPMTREDTIAKADLVAKGRLESVSVADEMALRVTATFHIEERIKGESPDTVTVATAGNSAACGITLAEGPAELALHRREDGTYHAKLCTQMGLQHGENSNVK